MLTALKVFVELVDSGSFTQAARRTYLSTSAVSQRMKTLEAELGHELIIRRRRGLELTPAGETFLAASREILSRYDQALAELDRLGGVVTGRIRVGAVPSVGLHALNGYIRVYLERYPSVDMQLEYLTSRLIYAGVTDGSLDLGVVAFPIRSSRLNIVCFREDELVLIVSPDHPLAKRHRVSPARLEGEAFVGFDDRIPTGRAITRKLRTAGVRVRPTHQFDNVEMLKRAVEIGQGVSIVPADTVAAEVEGGSLARVRLQGGDWSRPIAAVFDRNAQHRPTVRAFVDILRPPVK